MIFLHTKFDPVMYSLCLISWLIHRYLQYSHWNLHLAASCCNFATTRVSPRYLVLLRDSQSQAP